MTYPWSFMGAWQSRDQNTETPQSCFMKSRAYQGSRLLSFAFPPLLKPPHVPAASTRLLGACHIFFHPPPLDQKSPAIMEVKVPVGKVGKEERKGAAQEKKQLGIKDKEDKKGARVLGKESCWGVVWARWGWGGDWRGCRRGGCGGGHVPRLSQ